VNEHLALELGLDLTEQQQLTEAMRRVRLEQKALELSALVERRRLERELEQLIDRRILLRQLELISPSLKV
jgi:hypothetical protein